MQRRMVPGSFRRSAASISASPSGASSRRPRSPTAAPRLLGPAGGGLPAPTPEALAPRVATGDRGGREGVELALWRRAAEDGCLLPCRDLALACDGDGEDAGSGGVRVRDSVGASRGRAASPAPASPPTTAMTPVWTGSTGSRWWTPTLATLDSTRRRKRWADEVSDTAIDCSSKMEAQCAGARGRGVSAYLKWHRRCGAKAERELAGAGDEVDFGELLAPAPRIAPAGDGGLGRRGVHGPIVVVE